jgi:hypothetical protein
MLRKSFWGKKCVDKASMVQLSPGRGQRSALCSVLNELTVLPVFMSCLYANDSCLSKSSGQAENGIA